MFTFIEMILPTFMAILSLALFKKETRKMCYTTVILSILAELIPLEINGITLLACSACFGGMLIIDLLSTTQLLNLSNYKYKN